MDFDELVFAIEALTPGGSEFHDSPERCLEWIRERLRVVAEIAAERNRLREEAYMLRGELDHERW